MSITAPLGTIEDESNKDCDDLVECIYCGFSDVIKMGKRKTQCGERQRYQCKSCNRKFVADPIKGYKATAKLITLSMDLYFKGLSYRKIADTLFQFYDLEVHHETIRRWINTFMKAINKYVATLEPQLSGRWLIDEQNVKSKRDGGVWSWNALDYETRFLIANCITKEKDLSNTHTIFREIKRNTKQKPEIICTDGWRSYPQVIRNEYNVVEHKKNISLKDGGNNRVERYHGSWKERNKVMRGLENTETTAEMLQNYRTYYNFIRPHMSLSDYTPAEMASLKLDLGKKKWEKLILQSIKCNKSNFNI
jgi:transposase-like protein